ncbi:CD48 antigen isoform X2 [Carassius gibelio]|uniref:CD48 antigen isoform X2 n=1 Tax=Carassius gibelio TaxID=101364 RepID=UPI002277FE72|nr:CD48 antigen isoform X2 [Carassius gibelio]XP_052447264.1 CD48 antigen isoform X2 [Carassius gibelio]
MFDMFIFLFSWSLAGVFGDDAVKLESVMEGESVTLNPDVNTINELRWSFIHNNKKILIAIIDRQNEKRPVYDDVLGGRFKDRLKLDQTGSLIITNTRTTDSGEYSVTGEQKEKPFSIFNLTVYARLPVPVISHSSQNSSSSSSQQNCSFLCSVVNVSDVTLSWYKGNSSFSSISVSDLSRSLSLHLECLDDFYSCVVNNPIRNQTTHLNTELCQTCSGFVSQTVLISAAAAGGGFLLIVAAVGIFCICRKTDQEVQTYDREITYADPTFYKRHKSRVKEQDNVVYAGVQR